MKLTNILRRALNWKDAADWEGESESKKPGLRRMTETRALAIPAFFACVRIISESVASLPLIIYERQPNGDKRRARGFSLYRLMHDSPNEVMTSMQFRETMVSHICLRGNAFAWIEREDGEIVALWPLVPTQMEVKYNGKTIVYKYMIQGKWKTFPQDEILHLTGPSTNGYVGLSPLTQFRQTLGISYAVSEYAGTFFSNSATPGGVLRTDKKMSDQAIKRLRGQWENRHENIRGAFKTAILEGGMKFEQIGLSNADSQMLESRTFQVNEVCRLFRIPPHLVQELTRTTYANISEQSIEFVKYTLHPWLYRLEQRFNQSLLTEQERKRYYHEHLVDGLLRGDTKSRFEAYEIALRNTWMNVNEVRRLENMNARPGGDAFPQPKPEPKKKSRQLLDQSFDVNTRLNTIRTYEPAIQKATQKVLEFERDSIKAALGRSDIHLETWLQEFYQTEVPSLLKATFAPTFREFLEAIQGAVEDEIGAVTGDLTGDLDRITDRCAQSHVYASQALLSKHERTEDIEAETDGWTETRAAKIAGLEVTRGANKVAQAVYQSNGYQYNRWNIVGEKTCPWCEALAGRIFPIGAPFVEAGNFDVEGQVMAVKSTPTPPLHAGCDCYLSPA